jgi:hypothetical protein
VREVVHNLTGLILLNSPTNAGRYYTVVARTTARN